MIITFLGHSHIKDKENLHKKIKNAIITKVKKEEKVVFYCGGYGDFDNLCASVTHDLKASAFNCEVVFVTPYITESHQKKLEYIMSTNVYDSTLYPPLENVPLRFAISKRNEWMINSANLIICYVDHTHGGAYKSLMYAKRKKKTIVNLAE